MDPSEPAFFYNRVIVFASKEEFARAIKDFETSCSLDHRTAANVKEKIDYRRVRLKK